MLPNLAQTIPIFAAWVSDHPSPVLRRFKDVLVLHAQTGAPARTARRRSGA